MVGSKRSLLAELDVSIGELNDSFQRSRIPLYVRLVHSENLRGIPECDAFDSGGCVPKIAFEELVTVDDGLLDDIETWRDIYGADLVMFVGGDDIRYQHYAKSMARGELGRTITASIATPPMARDKRGLVFRFFLSTSRSTRRGSVFIFTPYRTQPRRI